MYSSKAWQLIPTCHRHACFIAWGEKENHQQLWVRDANPSRAEQQLSEKPKRSGLLSPGALLSAKVWSPRAR